MKPMKSHGQERPTSGAEARLRVEEFAARVDSCPSRLSEREIFLPNWNVCV
jgi:hypothetical protein